MRRKDKVDEILSHFPGPATLYQSRLRWICILLICAFFVAAGYGATRGRTTGIDVYLVWVSTILFGLGAMVALAVIARPQALKLDSEKFEVVGWRRWSVRWQEVTGFDVWYLPGRRVVYDVRKPRNEAMAWLAVVMSGHNGGTLPDTYGLSAEDLADLMTDWRYYALQRSPTAPLPVVETATLPSAGQRLQ